MKTKYLVISNGKLANGVPALVETYGDTPAEQDRFDDRVDGMNNGELIIARVPSYVSNPGGYWLQGYVDPIVREAIGSPCEDGVEDDYKVIFVNHPTLGHTVVVMPAIAAKYIVTANFGPHETTDDFQSALHAAQSLMAEEGVTYIDIDVLDKDGNENGTFSYYDKPDTEEEEDSEEA